MPAEGWNRDGNSSPSRLSVRQEGRARQSPPSPPSRSGSLQIDACGDGAPGADCRRKPTIREKARRGTRKPHPQRARQREQGGVVHDTYLAGRLLADTTLDRSAIRIIDPNLLSLASFRQKARACGMETLRSSFVHHIAPDPFILRASQRGQTGLTGDWVILATGFEPVFDHPLVEAVGDRLSLARGARGMPVREDDALAWRSTHGQTAPV